MKPLFDLGRLAPLGTALRRAYGNVASLPADFMTLLARLDALDAHAADVTRANEAFGAAIDGVAEDLAA